MKTIKKFLSTLSAAVLCTASVLSTSLVNATEVEVETESDQYATYAIYCDVPVNSGVMYTNLYFVRKDIEEIEGYIGNLGGEISTTSGSLRPNGEQSFLASYRAAGALAAPGNLFRVNLYTQSGFNVTEIRATAFDSKNGFMSNNPVTYDVVLVGDANSDGIVSVGDMVAIHQAIGNPSVFGNINYRAADTNYDGIVDSQDALIIQQYDARVIDRF